MLRQWSLGVLIDQDDLAAAAAAAVRGLLAAQDSRGCWLDFPQVGGGSDEWVTGYVGAAVAASAPAAAQRAWESLVARRRWSGGWGFMPSYPADADSTACALRLAESLPSGGGTRAWRARAFLARHQRASGGISTYLWPRRMMWHTRMRDRFDGWCAPHVCVSANAAHLARFRGRRRLLDFLRATQRADGSWCSYWWYDEREYATAFAAEALLASGDQRDAAAVRRAIDWARRARIQNGAVRTAAAPEGSAFATALRLRVLALGDDDDLAEVRAPMLEWLLAAQRADGLWPASTWLRFPPTEIADTASITEWHIGQMVKAGVMSDGYGLFTTATVLAMLRVMLTRGARARERARIPAAA
jgi:hypothetical protein